MSNTPTKAQEWCAPVHTPNREWERQGDRTLCARLRSQGQGGASLEHQAAARIERLERALRDVLVDLKCEHPRIHCALSWAEDAL